MMTSIGNLIKNPTDEKWAKSLEKIQEYRRTHDIQPMTAEEFIAGEKERDARSLREYQAAHPVDRVAQANAIGLKQDELDLDWNAIKPGINDAHKAAQEIKTAFELGHGMIFLWGPWGQAKTVIGKILVARAFASGKRAAYANFMDMLDQIRMAYDEDEHKMTELVRRVDWWTKRDVLFLDEFDKCNDTAWAVERKFQIVDRCYQRAIREEALTVIASNKGDDEVDGYIRSRLNDRRVGKIIYLSGVDGRKVMPDEWKH
jgi:DNA replication protein DnaC